VSPGPIGDTHDVQVNVRLSLPRDELSIPVLRRICTQALDVLGVEDSVASDVELALTEACANVLRHVRQDSAYEVTVGFDEERAFMEVVDQGTGFDPSIVPEPELEDESGRGLHLMRELMDSVHFESVRGSGMTVLLEKQLAWRDDAAMPRLAAATGHSTNS
jgi:serine/threonine-protein kinase RsbW